MREDSDGFPVVADTATGLGIRDTDLDLDEQESIHPGTGGMSVSPGRAEHIPIEFRPPALGGTGRHPVWVVSQDRLGESLETRPDPDDPEKHWFVEPVRPMPMQQYREALWETREFWRKYG